MAFRGDVIDVHLLKSMVIPSSNQAWLAGKSTLNGGLCIAGKTSREVQEFNVGSSIANLMSYWGNPIRIFIAPVAGHLRNKSWDDTLE
jgi:hypothetical protein